MKNDSAGIWRLEEKRVSIDYELVHRIRPKYPTIYINIDCVLYMSLFKHSIRAHSGHCALTDQLCCSHAYDSDKGWSRRVSANEGTYERIYRGHQLCMHDDYRTKPPHSMIVVDIGMLTHIWVQSKSIQLKTSIVIECINKTISGVIFYKL